MSAQVAWLMHEKNAPHNGTSSDTAESLRQKAAGFARLAASARDEVSLRELATLATLYQARAAELELASPAQTPETLRLKAADVLALAERALGHGWRKALREIAAIYSRAAAEREEAATAAVVTRADSENAD